MKPLEFIKNHPVWKNVCPTTHGDLIDLLVAYDKQNASEQIPVDAVVRRLGDYDIWYKPCENCGYDTGKSTLPKEGNKTCWKCGSFIDRDYTDRALKSA